MDNKTINDCAEWLHLFLKGGPKTDEAVNHVAKLMGFTEAQISEAKKLCGVNIIWSLPED